jgi:hypothetical protein
MLMANPGALAFVYHFGVRSNTEFVLLLVGLAFAGLLVWAIERGGKSTT